MRKTLAHKGYKKRRTNKNMSFNNKLGRRSFVKKTALLSGALTLGIPNIMRSKNQVNLKNSFTIGHGDVTFEREPLIYSYGFKGGYITRLWQVATKLQDASGSETIGLGVQSPLWSDSGIASKWGESGSSALMYNLTGRALQLIKGQTFASPIEMIDNILEEVLKYGSKITNTPDLRKTFALNALVSIDNAAWLLYAKQNGITSFDDLIPNKYRSGLSFKNSKVLSVPSISYSTSAAEILQLGKDGNYVIKIKIGAPGSQREMLEKDMARMDLIHKSLSNIQTENSPDGSILYYLDANGRYQEKETLLRYLDHCKKIGAFERILIVEEPFPEELKVDVSDIDVRLAADESAHTDKDTLERIEMGYSVIALKPIAKTLSMTLKIIKIATENNIPCICADLTVNPVLVDWNKSVAARLQPIPGFKDGLLETNGAQNYKNWETMIG
jgi:L-alanine-DL-glutamate epimerase-like enolase superfamily enzyme